MSPRLMSEPEAWREIARRLAEGERQIVTGLCLEVWKLGLDDDASQIKMCDRAGEHAHLFVGPEAEGYAFPPGTHQEERILAALFLALEAEDESRRVSPPGGAR